MRWRTKGEMIREILDAKGVKLNPPLCVFCGSEDCFPWYIKEWVRDELGNSISGEVVYRCNKASDIVGGKPFRFRDAFTGEMICVR